MCARPLALVTGASSGIGYHLALELARRAHDLLLVSRTAERLHDLADRCLHEFGAVARVIPENLSDPAAIERLEKQVELPVDVLVNNAGYGIYGSFHQGREADSLGMIDVNIRALTQLTQHFLPGMIHRGQGRILNVASTAAFQPGPGMAVYYATKAYVASFSQALSEELRHSGVTVTALCPGPTMSDFKRRAGLEGVRLFEKHTMHPAEVAKVGVRGMLRGRRLVIPGLRNRFLAQLVRVAPRRLAAAAVRKMQERRAHGA
jgi:short-subunit dehydrogenase